MHCGTHHWLVFPWGTFKLVHLCVNRWCEMFGEKVFHRNPFMKEGTLIQATFTPQVLMPDSDFLLRSDFLFGCSHYLLKCGLYQIPVSTVCGLELTRMRKRTTTMTSDAARCCTKVREVMAFISKCL